jgi:hypothetical protein
LGLNPREKFKKIYFVPVNESIVKFKGKKYNYYVINSIRISSQKEISLPIF